MKPICLALPGNDALAAALATAIGADVGELVMHRFPDGESYVRVASDVAARDVVLACTFDRPDAKLVPLLLVAATVGDLGAMRVGLVAPYLPYLRQDARFTPGEGITSVYFARILSLGVDWIVTVDAHLHRHPSLAAIYGIPARSVHAAPAIAAWIRAHVARPIVIGPDAESAQWVVEVAAAAGAPSLVLAKSRRGDRDVEIAFPDLERWPGRSPVLVDDILSTGRTMRAAIDALRRRGLPPPVVIAVHAVFADGAQDAVRDAATVVTANTIPHPTNAIDVVPLVADAVRTRLAATVP